MIRDRNLKQFILKNIATLAFVGYVPIAPGTFGSLIGMVVFAFLKPSNAATISLAIFTVSIGTLSAHQAETLLNEKDSAQIVIDEFAGYDVSVLFLPPTTS